MNALVNRGMEKPLLGLYRCQCGNFRWERLPRDFTTVETPACHGLMNFTWNFIDYKTDVGHRETTRRS